MSLKIEINFQSSLVKIAVLTFVCIIVFNGIAKAESREEKYRKCLLDYGLSWCKVGASIDTVEASFNQNCKKEYNDYLMALTMHAVNEGDLDPKQISEYAFKVADFEKVWQLDAYKQNCLK